MFIAQSKLRFLVTVSVLALAAATTGCSSIDRLSAIGEKPALSSIENPTTQPGYKPVQMPMPTPQAASYSPNSLWRNGSRALFKDKGARQVGDLITDSVNDTTTGTLTDETRPTR